VASRGITDAHEEGTPKVIAQNVGRHVAVSEIRDAYVKCVALKCTSSCVLDSVYTCYERQKGNNKAGPQIDCPKAVMNQHNSCRKCERILIRKLGQC